MIPLAAPPRPRSNYWHLLPYLRHYQTTIVAALACTIVFIGFWPLLAALAGRAAEYLAQGQVQAMGQLALVIAGGFLIHKTAQYGQDSLMAQAALGIAFDLRERVYRHLHRLDLSYFEQAKTGDLTYRLTEDVDRVGEAVNKIFHDTTPCILQMIVVLGYMIWLNWPMTLAAFVAVPLMSLLIGWFGDRLLHFARRSQTQISDLSSLLTEVLGGIRLVRAFAAEEYEIERFRIVADRNRRAQYAAEWLKAVQHPVVGFLYALCVLLLLLLGTWQVSTGNLTGSRFISYVAAVAMLIDPIAHLTENYNLYKQVEASLDRVFELMALEPTVYDRPEAFPLPPIQGRVEYRAVEFAYLPSQPVLRGLSFTVEPGQAIALVGASGAGKSTLVNLLPRFYDVTGGNIQVDGYDLRQVTLGSLRRQMAIVPQDITLFSGSVAQNIAFGQRDIDWAAVEAAAQVANAHSFIQQLPDGYRTLLGERGITLSGGQRQRLAIARAVLLDPRILILDEATSALDAESEALVQEALERLMKGRTVFIIAHRLATVRKADRILVIDQGQVAESGTHEELLAQGGQYAAYHAQQFQ